MACGASVGTRWPTPASTLELGGPTGLSDDVKRHFRHRHRNLVVVLSPEKHNPVPQLPQLGLISSFTTLTRMSRITPLAAR